VYRHIAELARMSKHAGEDAMASTVKKLEEKLDLYVKGRDGKQGSSKSERAKVNELLARIEMEREDERVRMRKEVTEAQRQARDVSAWVGMKKII
jgi:DNA invertase Pin-like site-specific DNA recombinase